MTIPWRILATELTQGIKTDLSTRVALASDASFYHLLPLAVARPVSEVEIAKLFAFSQHHQIPMTFRAAGTSLSGQAVTAGLLVDLSRHWRGVDVLEGGQKVQAQPGVVGGQLNALLRQYQRKIGPDPASINACMLGGILANNASGMCCGVAHNAYHSLDSLRFVLPSGQIFDSGKPEDAIRFEAECPSLAQGLLELRQQILDSPDLSQRIREKYRLKNTTGYSLNAFLDYSTPLEIFSHLLIGSEGTLAFISEAVLNTLPDLPCKYTGLLVFASVQAACEAIGPLNASGAKALELMDRASLRAIENQTELDWLSQLPENAAALLIEYQAEHAEALKTEIAAAEDCLQQLDLLRPALLTQKPQEQAQLWKIRKGLFPSVGAVRAQGTSVIIEDVVVKTTDLAEAVTALHSLFSKHGYTEAIIFGHARDGNLHFVITQSFNHPNQVTRYQAFMADLVDLIVGRFDGGLKAEHGTGRNMAPFVETEWGPEAYGIMQKLKALADPTHLLNPGVILNADPWAHVKSLKTLPIVEAEVDRCIECGFCEKNCPSRDLTLTPRQRIVLRREMARLQENPVPNEAERKALAELQADYTYAGLETCATDGLCALACPVGIDTGQLVKRLRAESHSQISQDRAKTLASHFASLEKTLGVGLKLGQISHSYLGTKRINRFLQAAVIQKTLGKWLDLPAWPVEWPSPAPARETLSLAEKEANADWVYYPSCITRKMGYADKPALPEVLLQLAAKAGIRLKVVGQNQCCGLPFGSKGFQAAGALLLNQSIEALWTASKAGTLPIVVDNSPCSWQLLSNSDQLTPDNLAKFQRLRIVDSVVFSQEVLVPALKPVKLKRSVVVHPVCSIQKMGLEGHLKQIVSACVSQAEVPLSAGCCGFAGDRGYLVPELTASATAAEAREVQAGHFEGHYCSSRTCELGLERASGNAWVSYLYLLAEAVNVDSALISGDPDAKTQFSDPL